MKKGDISNKRAFGVGVDVSIMVEQVPPTRFLDKVLNRKAWKVTGAGRQLAEAILRLDFRLVVFAPGMSDVDFHALVPLLDTLVLRIEQIPSDVELGNEGLRDVDVYFTSDTDFYDVWRYFKNVRLWEGVGPAMNYLRFFE